MTVGAVKSEREMAALNSTLTNGRIHQENRNKRCGQGWRHPIQTLNKSQRCTWLVRRQGVWHAVFSFIELSISCLTRQTCLGSSGKTCLMSHMSRGTRTADSFPGKRRTGENRQGPQQPLQCQGTRVPVTFPSFDVPAPAKEL